MKFEGPLRTPVCHCRWFQKPPRFGKLLPSWCNTLL